MKSIAIALILVATMCFTGCPKPQAKETQKVLSASSELAGDTQAAIKMVKTLFESKAISLAVKDKLADALIKIASAGSGFNQLVMVAVRQADGGLSQVGFLAAHFDEVVKPFLGFLDTLKLLSPQANKVLSTSIAALKTAVIIIAASLSRAGATTSTGRLLQSRRDLAWAV